MTETTSESTEPAVAEESASPTTTAETAADAAPDFTAAVVSDGAYALVCADFAGLDAALEAYEELKQATEADRLKIEGAMVLRKNEDGKVEVQKASDYQTRRGLKWGLVGGVALGVLFPPSIIGSAAVLGGAGAGIGRLRHRHYRQELADELGTAIEPGHSGLVALVSDPVAVELDKALAKADRIVQKAVDKAVADEIRAEAKEAEKQSDSQA